MEDFDTGETDFLMEGYVSEIFYVDFRYNIENQIKNIIIKAYNRDYPDREIKNENISSGIWYDDKTLIYGVRDTGLYKFNCITGEKNTILEESRDYEIEKIEDGYLFFDDVKIKI